MVEIYIEKRFCYKMPMIGISFLRVITVFLVALILYHEMNEIGLD